MSGFTVINPRKRQRSDSPSFIEDGGPIDGKEEQFPLKERVAMDVSDADFDKENEPAPEPDGVHEGKKSSTVSTDTIDLTEGDAIAESASSTGTDDSIDTHLVYEPPTFLIHDPSAVPEHLLHKAYDTNPPPYVPRASVLQAAERLPPSKRKYEFDSSDTEPEHQYVKGPSSKRRRKDNMDGQNELQPKKLLALKSKKVHIKIDNKLQKSGRQSTINSHPNDDTSTLLTSREPTSAGSVVNGRKMITAPKVASKLQKILAGFPSPKDPFPEDFTLTELCTRYPNHLFGENLYPFLQHGWSAIRIAALLPDQDGVPEEDRITGNAIASRMKKIKARLEKSGKFDLLMNDLKTHAELSINTEKERTDGEESEDDTELAQVRKPTSEQEQRLH